MAKKKSKVISGAENNRLTSDCVHCEYGKLTEDKKIMCKKQSKFFMYGKRIVCDDYKEKK